MSDGSCRVSDSFQFCGTNRISEPGAPMRYQSMVIGLPGYGPDRGRCGPEVRFAEIGRHLRDYGARL
jgi:hypothetical protein